ncbi:MAG: hypothetical protein H6966_09800 [Chromatiaceae bacterium]|nr:hypothetical protein [Chromatiaceae bacterium]
MAREDFSYLGSGRMYMREFGSNDPLAWVGNSSSLNGSIEEDSIKKPDYTQPGGGTFNEVKRVNSAKFSLVADELDGPNLARVVFGSATAHAAATGKAENGLICNHGGLTPFEFPPSSITSVKTADDVTTYVEGMDYEVRPAGIIPLATGSMVDGDPHNVVYDHLGLNVVEALTSSAKEWEVFFEGYNEARSGKPVTVHLFRVKFGAAKNLQLIGSEHLVLESDGEMLKDLTKTGTGKSQYMKAVIV